jgi:hypothetical protein
VAFGDAELAMMLSDPFVAQPLVFNGQTTSCLERTNDVPFEGGLQGFSVRTKLFVYARSTLTTQPTIDDTVVISGVSHTVRQKHDLAGNKTYLWAVPT